MAKTIFDLPEPRSARSGARFLADTEDEKSEAPSQAEEGEPEVVSEPKLDREAFSYLEPRKGIDAPGDFRACSSCKNFVPERAFHAATTGNHCVLFGSFPVAPNANCARYVPWPMGKPIESVIEAHALACLNGSRASLSPFDAGYCEDHGHSHKCRNCRHYDFMGDAETAGPECEFMEELNRELPNIFQLREAVDPDGGCSAWVEPIATEDNPSGQEGAM